MHKKQVWVPLLCCVFAAAIASGAQFARKAGLWEITTSMTFQQSPFPPGMKMPPGVNSPFSGAPMTSQVCVTQAYIDKYGAPIPQSQGDCKVSNISIQLDGMRADMDCTGQMTGHGTLVSSWSDGNQATGTMHFTGTMQARPFEFTVKSTSAYRGADCGSVQPLPMK